MNNTCLETPFKCSDVDWSYSFDREGWSKCGKDNLFITAFYRKDPQPKGDPISSLEEARCCSAVLVFSGTGGQGECKRAHWWIILNKYVHKANHNTALHQRLNISKDVKLLFFARSLGFQVIRHFHAPRYPRKKHKQAILLGFQYKSIGKTLLQARKLAFLQKLPNRAALLVKNVWEYG